MNRKAIGATGQQILHHSVRDAKALDDGSSRAPRRILVDWLILASVFLLTQIFVCLSIRIVIPNEVRDLHF